MVVAGDTMLALEGERVRGGGGHGTFGEPQAKAQSSRAGWSRAALAAAGACAVVVVVALAGFVTAQPSELYADDVTHDGAMQEVGGRRHAVASRGRGGLSAHSSIADFFHAAMRGDFEQNEGNVKLATDGLFDGHARLSSTSKAKYQSLASRRLRAKAVHTAPHGAAVHKQLAPPHVLAARTQQLPGGVVLHAPSRVRGVSENKWAFPSEDKFVARYTGRVPRGDILVDSFTNGPFTPI